MGQVEFSNGTRKAGLSRRERKRTRILIHILLLNKNTSPPDENLFIHTVSCEWE